MKYARCTEDAPRAPAGMNTPWSAAFLAVAVMVLPGVASATPNFAREYSKNCAMCHTVAPQLNRAGYEFRLAGYRFPDEIGEEQKDADFNLGNRTAARLDATYTYARRSDAASGTSTGTSDLEFDSVSLFPLTGSWGKYFGSFVELETAPEEPIEIGMAFVRGVYGDANGWLQTRLGIMHPWEGFGASDDPISIGSPLFHTQTATGSPFFLQDLNEMAWEVGYYFKPFGTAISARVGNGIIWNPEGEGVAEPAQGGALRKDETLPARDAKSYAFVINQFIAGESAVTVRYYRTQVVTPNPFDTSAAPNACAAGIAGGTPGVGCTTDNIERLTAYANFFAIPKVLNILAGYGWGNDDIADPTVDPSLADVGESQGYFAELNYYPIEHRLGTGVRYDSFDPSDKGSDDRQNQYAVFGNFMAYKGLQFLGEYRVVGIKQAAGTDRDRQFQLLFRLTQ